MAITKEIFSKMSHKEMFKVLLEGGELVALSKTDFALPIEQIIKNSDFIFLKLFNDRVRKCWEFNYGDWLNEFEYLTSDSFVFGIYKKGTSAELPFEKIQRHNQNAHKKNIELKAYKNSDVIVFSEVDQREIRLDTMEGSAKFMRYEVADKSILQ